MRVAGGHANATAVVEHNFGGPRLPIFVLDLATVPGATAIYIRIYERAWDAKLCEQDTSQS